MIYLIQRQRTIAEFCYIDAETAEKAQEFAIDADEDSICWSDDQQQSDVNYYLEPEIADHEEIHHKANIYDTEGDYKWFRNWQADQPKPFRVDGTLAISNHGGIAVEIDPSGDTLRYKWFDEEPVEAEIHHDEVDSYFMVEEAKYYLKDFYKAAWV